MDSPFFFRHSDFMAAPLKSSRRDLRRIIGLASTALLSMTAIGAGKASPLKAGEIGVVASVLDGDTLYLEDGLKVRLSAIQAPKLPLGRKGFKAWPMGEEAKAALTALTQKRRVQLYYGGNKRDRYGRALAQVFTLNAEGKRDLWIQEEMVRFGLGRVYTWPDTWQDSERLYVAERKARESKRGIWGNPYYAIRSPEPNMLAQDVDSFQLVEGIITSTADVRGTVYLNFGADYKTDFTIVVAKKNRRKLERAGLDPMSLEGAKVRIRGWIELQNGPMIWLDDAKRLEILDDDIL